MTVFTLVVLFAEGTKHSLPNERLSSHSPAEVSADVLLQAHPDTTQAAGAAGLLCAGTHGSGRGIALRGSPELC